MAGSNSAAQTHLSPTFYHSDTKRRKNKKDEPQKEKDATPIAASSPQSILYKNGKPDHFITIERMQLQSTARTLPLHSPHSPLHPSSYPNKQQNKLSSRYINNKIPPQINSKLYSPQTTNCMEYHKKEVCKSASKNMICSCEILFESTESKLNKNISDDIVVPNLDNGKRLISIRNAATSPTLFNRKAIKQTSMRFQNVNQTADTFGTYSHTVFWDSSEKSELSDLKQPKNRYTDYQTTVLTDESKMPCVKIGATIGDSDIHEQTYKICKSEQTSPNILDIDKSKFGFNKNNRSTGSLFYIPSDPWIKKPRETSSRPSKIVHNADDPWVRRKIEGAFATSRSPKKIQFRQVKSFGSSGADFLASTSRKSNYLRPQIQRCKTSLENEDPAFETEFFMLSSSNSPHLLTTPGDVIPSLQETESHSLMTSKSASFSPARTKNSKNPFTDYSKELPLSQQYQPTSHNKRIEPILQNNISSRNLLNVCNPNLLQARHSFSASSKTSKDELQLNIRRLSDQMRRLPFGDTVQLSLSDCNVSNIAHPMYDPTQQSYIVNLSVSQKNIHTDGTQGFQENNGADVPNKSKASDLQSLTITVSADRTKKSQTYATNHKADPLLETTC